MSEYPSRNRVELVEQCQQTTPNNLIEYKRVKMIGSEDHRQGETITWIFCEPNNLKYSDQVGTITRRHGQAADLVLIRSTCFSRSRGKTSDQYLGVTGNISLGGRAALLDESGVGGPLIFIYYIKTEPHFVCESWALSAGHHRTGWGGETITSNRLCDRCSPAGVTGSKLYEYCVFLSLFILFRCA